MGKYFELGQYVKVSKHDDNDSYDSFRNKKLKIIHVARGIRSHPGYDDTMNGEPLYDLEDAETNNAIDCSLYFYELEEWEETDDRDFVKLPSSKKRGINSIDLAKLPIIKKINLLTAIINKFNNEFQDDFDVEYFGEEVRSLLVKEFNLGND